MTSLVDCLRAQKWGPCTLACEWIRFYSDPQTALSAACEVRSSDFEDEDGDGSVDAEDGWMWVRWLAIKLYASGICTHQEMADLATARRRFDRVYTRADELIRGENWHAGWDESAFERVTEASCRRHLVPAIKNTAWWRQLAGQVFAPHAGDIEPQEECAV